MRVGLLIAAVVLAFTVAAGQALAIGGDAGGTGGGGGILKLFVFPPVINDTLMDELLKRAGQKRGENGAALLADLYAKSQDELSFINAVIDPCETRLVDCRGETSASVRIMAARVMLQRDQWSDVLSNWSSFGALVLSAGTIFVATVRWMIGRSRGRASVRYGG